jgi:predicted HTH transcriptional regulator
VLKTVAAFLNTDGGALVVGVDDDGALTGIDNDSFPSNDKFLLHFTNMVNQHIGPEFSEYIKFGIRAVGEWKVFVVVCREAPKPAFIRDRDQDKFFIRSGPSSRQLTTSQVLEYVKDRGKELS